MRKDKRAAILDLHATMVSSLFCRRPWLADRDTCEALSKKIDELGLQEHVPGDMLTTKSTALGTELQLDLMMVFIGLLDEWDMVMTLEQYGLIDEVDAAEIYDILEKNDDPERVLRPIVRKAFQDHYNPSGLLV